MKQFKVAKTELHKVWAENEEEAIAMFESRYKQYYAHKNNIDIFSSVLDKIEKPWSWQEVENGQTKYYEWDDVRIKNEPTNETIIVKVLQERDEQVIDEIKNYLETNYPITGDEEFIPWHWDTQNGEFELLSCAFGDNFYDYGEEPKEFSTDDSKLTEMIEKYPEYFFILDCGNCCRCAGW